MIVVKVRDREIRVAPTAPVTSGSVGLPVRWTFSEEWDGLTKTAVFRGSDTARDVFLTDDVCVVPAEVLEQSGGPLEIGVRGVKITHDEDTDEDIVTVVIPTIWGRIDRIYDGTIPSEADPSVPEPDWTEQVKAAATEALSKATAVEEAAARGDFDGVSPEVTIAEITHGHSVTISDRDHPEGQSFPVLDGASAYEQAAAGGYEGTEAEFNADLAGFSEKEQTATSAAAAAAQSAQNAANSASTAATKAGEAAQSAATASTHKDAADSSAQAAANSATSANSSANAASTSAGAASASAASASTSAQNAAGSASTASTAAATAQRHATNAEASATAAGRSATAADNSAQAAAQSAQAIEEYEHDAEAWAIGKRGGTDVDSSDATYQNNSAYYAEQAAASSSAASSAASAAAQSATDAASEAASSKSYSRSSYISSTMASGSATAAAEAQTAAETAASTAEGHATNAASSATAASGSATAAAQSATEAGNASTAATTAQEAAEDAQEAAETAAQSVSQSAAQISQNTSDISTLKSATSYKDIVIADLPYSIYHPSGCKIGKYLNSVGDEIDYPSWAISPYLELGETPTYFIKTGVSSTVVKNAYYKDDLTFLEPFDPANIAGTYVLSPPQNAKFVRFSIQLADINDFTYTSKVLLDSALPSNISESIKTADFKNLISRGHFYNSTGDLQNSDSWAVTQLFAVKPGDIITVKNAFGQYATCFKADLSFDERHTITGTGSDVFIVNNTTEYIAFNIVLANLDIFDCSINGLSCGARYNIKWLANSEWGGKKYISHGDSITWRDGTIWGYGPDQGRIARGYQTIFAEAVGLESCNNQGKSGWPMAVVNGNGVVNTILSITDYSVYDLCTIACGTNDFKLNVPLGQLGIIGDTTFDDTTFYGAYRKAVEYILTKSPVIRLVLMTPLQRDNAGYDVNTVNTEGHKLIDYVNAIKAIGEMYGLPVCDMYANSGFTKKTLATYTIDGLHPNTVGYIRMGNYLTGFLNAIGN